MIKYSFILTYFCYSLVLFKVNGTTINRFSESDTVLSSINIQQLYQHLTQLERLAVDQTRAIQTVGFNSTIDYLYQYLKSETNLVVEREEFFYRPYQLIGTPSFSSIIDGKTTNHIYSTILSQSDYSVAQYSLEFNQVQSLPLVSIPNFACSDSDWSSVSQSFTNKIVIVKRGDCTFTEKASLAEKYKAAALLIYNDGTASDRFQPITINLGEYNQVPCLFLSYNVGQGLVSAVSDTSKSVSIRLVITVSKPSVPVSNVCAHTITGDPTKTILIGSHSDSVPAGPGINDNGSGTAANLVLAKTVSNLIDKQVFPRYNYRVRFCWWGAEEVGLIGSAYHVNKAKQSTTIGQRLSDYLVNINLDMIGSPNFIFGIYNGNTAPSSTPASAKPGSNKMTTLFRDWFNNNGLPSDYTSFDGRSDYGPFLAAGIAAGGLFTGADGTKTVEQRIRYESILGEGLGGISGIRLDACYHRLCDNNQNINKFAIETMTRATAFAIDSLINQEYLQTWLYPTKNFNNEKQQLKHHYDSINEYFQYPYL